MSAKTAVQRVLSQRERDRRGVVTVADVEVSQSAVAVFQVEGLLPPAYGALGRAERKEAVREALTRFINDVAPRTLTKPGA